MENHKGALDVPVQYDKEPGSLLTVFAAQDAAIADMFREYHLRHAQLRALCVACNLTRPHHPAPPSAASSSNALEKKDR